MERTRLSIFLVLQDCMPCVYMRCNYILPELLLLIGTCSENSRFSKVPLCFIWVLPGFLPTQGIPNTRSSTTWNVKTFVGKSNLGTIPTTMLRESSFFRLSYRSMIHQTLPTNQPLVARFFFRKVGWSQSSRILAVKTTKALPQLCHLESNCEKTVYSL